MSSQSDEPYRLLMPADLFIATIEGNKAVLMRLLELETKEQTETKVAIEDPHLRLQPGKPTDVQTTTEAPHYGDDTNNRWTVQDLLRSARNPGNSVFHLLVNMGHNELALMVFKTDTSLLKLKNGMSETPLHYAAKAGNKEVITNLIAFDSDVVKGELEEKNVHGENALHIATKQGHLDCVIEFLNLNEEILGRPNNEQLYQLIHIATTKGYTDIVIHFMKKYPDHAKFLDSRGRNIFHIAAEENQEILFVEIFRESSAINEMAGRMNNAVDYEGNTPMHIAAMKGHTSIVRAIWENKTSHIHIIADTVKNNEGLTPFEVSRRQLGKLEYSDGAKICKYLRTKGDKFTAKWFDDVAAPPIANYWQKIQVIGLGSVLITTVTFAAAFTIPGGYNQDYGTPILGRKRIFRAFITANSLAFIQGFLSLFALLGNAMEGPTRSALEFAIYAFILAASSMGVAFGLGMYATLAPVSLPLAIIILVITVLLASPALFYVIHIGQQRIVYYISEYFMLKSCILIMYVLSMGTILCLTYLL